MLCVCLGGWYARWRDLGFDSVTLQCASHQVAAFGDMIANFGMKVYLTDGCAGGGAIL